MRIGSRLTEERQRLGYTQADMAKRGGIAFRTYCDYESGRSEPRGSFLAAIADHGVDILYVIVGTRGQKSTTLSREEEALLDNYRHADPQDQAAARRLLNSLAESRKQRA